MRSTLYATLTALGKLRAQADCIEADIKTLEAPHKAAMTAATGTLRTQLRALQTAADELAAAASTQYLAAAKTRAASIAAAPDRPAESIPLPTGCTVRWLTAVEITDPQALPRFVLVPDNKLLKDALVAAVSIDGAALTQHPTFAFSKPKEDKTQ